MELDYALEVTLPENTAHEVVDVSARDKLEINTKAKLFSSVSYTVASDWMRLANGSYDQMSTEGLSAEEVLQTTEFSDNYRIRLRECFAAVAVDRSHPTLVSHRVTLRSVSDLAPSKGVDPGLVAIAERGNSRGNDLITF